MNFLAHCALANEAAVQWHSSPMEREGLLAGAVIGDFTKGPIAAHWPTPLQAGVRLHRKIDAMSNADPAITRSCNRFPPSLRRLAPIFVDILADHCLSMNWDRLHTMALREFAAECYTAIDFYDEFLGPRGRKFASYMRQEDLLSEYHQWRHIEQALHSVLRRLERTDDFPHVNRAVTGMVEEGTEDFFDYYATLRGALAKWNAFEAIAARQTE